MRVLITVIACVFLSACSSEETKTVEHFMADADDRKATLIACANDPGNKAIEPNCVNAREAEHKSLFNPNNTGMPGIK